MANPKFVKFQRGSEAAYAALAQKEEDALYFIYDKNHPENGGKLYLGETLIGGTGTALGASALSELSDVDLTGLSDSALLCYDAAAEKWILEQPSSLFEGVSVSVGTKGGNETVAAAQARLNPSPNEGDILIISGDSYIYDGAQWQPLKSQDLDNRVTVLESEVATLQTSMDAVDGKIATAISTANHLTYQVVGDLDDVNDAITEAGPDLNRTIFLVPSDDGEAGNLYDEYMVINNIPELLGNFGADLSDYVTSSQLTTAVGNLNDRIDGLETTFDDYLTVSRFEGEVGNLQDLIDLVGDSSTNVIDELINIYGDVNVIRQMLEWHDLNN